MLVLRTESLGDRDREAGAEAQAQADYQEVHRARGADGCQLLRPQIPADNRRIHEAVELLEQHTEQQRGRKGKDQLQRFPFRKIFGHGTCHAFMLLLQTFCLLRCYSTFPRPVQSVFWLVFPPFRTQFRIRKSGHWGLSPVSIITKGEVTQPENRSLICLRQLFKFLIAIRSSVRARNIAHLSFTSCTYTDD